MRVHRSRPLTVFFFFNDTATTEIYTLSLHDALPICQQDDEEIAVRVHPHRCAGEAGVAEGAPRQFRARADRKSTRLNSSHGYISYAVFCLKKKKKTSKVRWSTHAAASTYHPRSPTTL